VKPTVFQWHADGSEIIEQTIADTGGHHSISDAEAIVRGLAADFAHQSSIGVNCGTETSAREASDGRGTHVSI
jgi:hypothetical protein